MEKLNNVITKAQELGEQITFVRVTVLETLLKSGMDTVTAKSYAYDAVDKKRDELFTLIDVLDDMGVKFERTAKEKEYRNKWYDVLEAAEKED